MPIPRRANTVCLTLLEATLTLYPANAAGEPDLTQPLWMGVEANNISIRDRWLQKETRPTGAKFPVWHPLVPQYEIAIDRVWVLPLEQMAGFLPGRGKYVLDIVWQDELSRDWHREVYYGVTISERGRAAEDRDGEFIEKQVWNAQYHAPPTSGRGAVPPIAGTLPFTVRYVTGTENIELYSYNPDTDLFTEASAGVATGRATLAYTGGLAGEFAINFAGDDITAFRVTGGEVHLFALRVGSPTLADLPRVEFWYGANRVGAVTRDGTLHATRFQALNPLEGDKFQIYSGGNLSFTLDATAATGNFVAFEPADVAGLKLWARVESLGVTDAPVWLWPDESGQGNDLAPVHLLGDESGDSLTDEESDPLTTEDQSGLPQLVQSPNRDDWTLHDVPVTGPAVRFQQSPLDTIGNVFNPDQHTIFIVACPFGPGSGATPDQKLVTSPAGLNQYELVLLGGVQPRARYWPNSGGPQLNTATGAVLGTLTQPVGWHLFEMEADSVAGYLKLRVDGTEVGAENSLVGAASGTMKPVQLGDDAFWGYVKAVLIYEGKLSATAQARLRRYLNNTYGIY